MNLFRFKHLQDVKMSYLSHFYRSFSIGIYFGIASCKALVHAIYPDLFITSSSDLIKDLAEELEEEIKKK